MSTFHQESDGMEKKTLHGRDFDLEVQPNMYNLMLLIILPYVTIAFPESTAGRDCKSTQPTEPLDLIWHLFQEMDINENNKLSFSELVNISKLLSKANRTFVLLNQFRRQDLDNSSDFNFEEFEQLFSNAIGGLLACKNICINNNDDYNDEYFTNALNELGIETDYDEKEAKKYELKDYIPKPYSIQIQNANDAKQALTEYARNLSIFECADSNGDKAVTPLEAYSYLSQYVQIRNTIEFLNAFIDSLEENNTCLDINGLSHFIHIIIRKCSIITRTARATCYKLRTHTVLKNVELGQLPVDSDSVIALALHTVPDTYVIVRT
uniref:EF-hand domain-containing protein n=1 Tax=Setaria digitata TaxID=48799 RepID=A0A915PMB6_9BILA